MPLRHNITRAQFHGTGTVTDPINEILTDPDGETVNTESGETLEQE